MLPDDQAAFLPLPKDALEARRVTEGMANAESLVRCDSNDDSIPVQYAFRKLLTVATVDEVRLVFEGPAVTW